MNLYFHLKLKKYYAIIPNWLHFKLSKFMSGVGDLNPCFGVGIVSSWFVEQINVLDSTRATSFGSVNASQLKI